MNNVTHEVDISSPSAIRDEWLRRERAKPKKKQKPAPDEIDIGLALQKSAGDTVVVRDREGRARRSTIGKQAMMALFTKAINGDPKATKMVTKYIGMFIKALPVFRLTEESRKVFRRVHLTRELLDEWKADGFVPRDCADDPYYVDETVLLRGFKAWRKAHLAKVAQEALADR